jgi:hypothetical protein
VKPSVAAFFYGIRLVTVIGLILPFFSGNRHEHTPLHLPYGYYELLRVVVWLVALLYAWAALGLNKAAWVCIFGIIVVMFNPLFPFRFDKGTWHVIDGITALLLVVSLFTLRESANKS